MKGGDSPVSTEHHSTTLARNLVLSAFFLSRASIHSWAICYESTEYFQKIWERTIKARHCCMASRAQVPESGITVSGCAQHTARGNSKMARLHGGPGRAPFAPKKITVPKLTLSGEHRGVGRLYLHRSIASNTSSLISLFSPPIS